MKKFMANMTVKQTFVLASSLAAVFLILGIWAFASRLTAGELEADARKSQQIPAECLLVQDAGGDLAALLFYDPVYGGSTFSIYVNSGLALKNYHFTKGGSASQIDFSVGVFPIGDDVALLSMNTVGAVRLEVSGGEPIALEPDVPFVKVLPGGVGFRLYDANGAEIILPYDLLP